jgi:hypothetical protein
VWGSYHAIIAHDPDDLSTPRLETETAVGRRGTKRCRNVSYALDELGPRPSSARDRVDVDSDISTTLSESRRIAEDELMDVGILERGEIWVW